MIKTTFVYTEEALIEFFTFHLKRKDKIRWIYYAVACAFFIIALVATLVFKENILGLLIAVATTIMLLSFSRRAKRAAKKTANSRYKRNPQDIIFKDERIEQHLDDKILVYKWDLVKEVDETPLYMYFYISKTSAIIVSKDCITEDEYNQLVELVKSKNKNYVKYSHI
jgi:hypothetical protein